MNPERKGIVFNIERYHVHDGAGIRTMVFLKGCPLDCPWCCNPESGRTPPEAGVKYNLCTGCGKCAALCPLQAVWMDGNRPVINRERCAACGACSGFCPAGAREIYGEWMTPRQVLEKIRGDEAFFRRSGGGITFSGGEPCMQAEFVRECMRLCRLEGFDVNLETCGAVEYGVLYRTAELASLVLYDIKTLDAEAFDRFSPISLAQVLNNLERLAADGKGIRIRCPVIPGLNDTKTFVDGVIEIAKRIGVSRVDLLPLHHLGSYKYGALGRTYAMQDVPALAREAVAPLRDRILRAGLESVIGG